MVVPALVAVALAVASVSAQAPSDTVVYEAYAIRFGTIPQFRVAALVAGADPARRLDIPVMVWLLKGANGRTVLIDSGFHRQKFVEQWKVAGFRSPAEVLKGLGIAPDQVTDVIVTHAHWDHVGGVELFPKATIWMQREEYAYYTGPAWHSTKTRGGIDEEDMLSLLRINMQGRVRLVDGDDKELIPGIRCYTGGKHTFASQYVTARTSAGTALFASDNLYLYENLEKRVPVAQTLDAAANLKAQDRMRTLASRLSLIVPGHDPAVFERYTKVGAGIVRIE